MTETGLELIERLSYENTKLRSALLDLLDCWTAFERSDRNHEQAYNFLVKSAFHAWLKAQLAASLQSPNEGETK